jgi:hypothetical protein
MNSSFPPYAPVNASRRLIDGSHGCAARALSHRAKDCESCGQLCGGISAGKIALAYRLILTARSQRLLGIGWKGAACSISLALVATVVLSLQVHAWCCCK